MLTLIQNPVQTPTLGLELSQTTGNTPLLRLDRLTADLPPTVQVLAKAEWHNASGSVKDRPALNIIRNAIAAGHLQPGGARRLLDSTSGNMGIAYATYGAAFGIPVTLTMPANASPERIAMLQALGAEVILTDPLEGTDGAMETARQMAAEAPETYWYANQYDNPANWQAHFLSTGPEIWQQTGGHITHFVAGMGTSGTLTGVSRYLRTVKPDVRIVGLQPAGPFHGLEGLKHMETAIRPGIYDPSSHDEVLHVPSEAAYETTRRLAREAGIFVGISAGAAVWGALQVARRLERGVVVTILPDAGFKYLSHKELWNA